METACVLLQDLYFGAQTSLDQMVLNAVLHRHAENRSGRRLQVSILAL